MKKPWVHMTSCSKRLRLLILIGLILLPSAVWIIRDKQSFINYDQYIYANASLTYFQTLQHTPSLWLHSFFTQLRCKTPLVPWLGQIFSVFCPMLPQAADAFLFFTLLIQAAALYMLWELCQYLFSSARLAVIGLLFIAISPLFIRLSISYLVEPLQMLLIAAFLYVTASAARRTTVTNICILSLLLALSVLTKISSPFYLCGAALVFFWQHKTNTDTSLPLGQGRKKYRIWLVFSIFFFIMLAIFIKLNFQRMVDLLRSAFFDPYWGSNKPFVFKMIYWSEALSDVFSGYPSFIFILAGLMCFSFITIFDRHRSRALCDKMAFASSVQIILFIITMSFAVNETRRYAYPLFPYVVILICWGLSQIRSRRFNIALVSVLVFNFLLVHAWNLGLVNDQMLRSFNPKLFRNAMIVQTSNAADAALAGVFETIGKQAKTKRTIFLSPRLSACTHPKIVFYKTVFSPVLPGKTDICVYPCDRLRGHYGQQEEINNILWNSISKAGYYLGFNIPIAYDTEPICRLDKQTLQRAALFIETKISENKEFTKIPVPNHPEILLYKNIKK